MADDPEISFIKQLSVSAIRRDYYASLTMGTARVSVECTVCLFPPTAALHTNPPGERLTFIPTIDLCRCYKSDFSAPAVQAKCMTEVLQLN